MLYQGLYTRLVLCSSSAVIGSGKNHVLHVNLILSMLGNFSRHSHEVNKIYINRLKRNPGLPQHVEKHSPVLQYLQFLFSPLWSGFLGQQQHPVFRVCVSSSARLVQSPSACPFPPLSQFFPQPRVFPALG